MKDKNGKATNKYKIEKLRDLDDSFKNTCVSFCFANDDPGELIFFNNQEVFRFNYADETAPKTIVCRIQAPIER